MRLVDMQSLGITEVCLNTLAPVDSNSPKLVLERAKAVFFLSFPLGPSLYRKTEKRYFFV
jgi:hypothetical protein